MKIDFYKHNLNRRDKKECMNILNSIFLTTGSFVNEFEKKFASYTGNEFAVGVTSCTDALFLALKYFGIGEGDEVITTPLSFIATTNVIEYCGARPVFVDVEESTGNIDASLIEKHITKRTKAILVVHLYGHLCDMKVLRRIADAYKLKVIEDCAHCIEGERDGIKPGQLGDVGCFSFYATKNITSGEGGMITCHDEKAYEWFKKARLHGMSKNAADRYTKKYEHYDMEFLGYKCNMTNIQAALLIHQLERIEILLKRKEKIWKRYDEGFKKNERIKTPKILPNTKHARHLYTVWVDSSKRDSILHQLQDSGIGVAVNFRPIPYMSYYKNKYSFTEGMFPISEYIGNSTITLPFYPKLTSQEIDYVIETLNAIV
ncbi:MAG: DegT/DnrJ/EryC1/StrS family aminotransferase [Patescibacteria group bacterium]|nr:DegT/DnrJ/EryC1/StrS family aminotransferase [Patescibacteria group bacterium]